MKNKREPSRERERVPPNTAGRQLSLRGTSKLYSDVAAGHDEKKYKITIRNKGTHTLGEIKSLMKEKVKLTEIKVGIKSLTPLRDGRVIIEVGSKREMESLEEGIRERCGEELEINIQKLRKLRLVILNIPSEITMENIKETLTQQNTEIDIREGSFEPKFSYKTKRGTRNLVAEVDSETRKKL
jgi:hypothetical protein